MILALCMSYAQYYEGGLIMNELCSYISCMTFIMIPTSTITRPTGKMDKDKVDNVDKVDKVDEVDKVDNDKMDKDKVDKDKVDKVPRVQKYHE